MAMSRIEKDFLGELLIPDQAYYGVQTLRAMENFKITDIPISIEPRFVAALGYVKKAAALANLELGSLPRGIGPAIIAACDAVIAGELDDQFLVDVIQGGAGTSTNMNANEVIANRALEELGRPKGSYDVVHPNNHVNCSQSTNDAYPTALRVALLLIVPGLIEAMQNLSAAFRAKADEFGSIFKIGRTQLQDAVPMTLGQEFGAFSTTILEDVERLETVNELFHEVNLGATAIGTGLNAPPGYTEKAVSHLARLTGLPLISSLDLIEATWDTGAYVQLSGVLRRIAVKLSKICNDLRLLSSGPRAGLNEINLPPVQPGSSIMPAKVNPVIPEAVNQIAFQTVGHDVAIAMAAEAGQLQLNAMEPLIAYNLFTMLESLKRGCRVLDVRCVRGITANQETCAQHLNNSLSIVTVLNPILGYENSCALAKEAAASGRTIRELVLKKGIMDEKRFDQLVCFDRKA
jgi:aspartate ammonia-lyase